MTKKRNIVVKIGSALLANLELLTPRYGFLQRLLEDIAQLRAEGTNVILCSSGSVALGLRIIGETPESAGVSDKQAAAACGMPLLLNAYKQVGHEFGFDIAQVLLTLGDFEDHRRFLNTRNTVHRLLESNVVPIVNENDTIVTDQIKYGDNDRLAARVAQMISADLLVLLSDVDGVYTADPRSNPDAKHIPYIEELTPEIEAMATGANADAGVGTGGMATKLMAARIAAEAGCATLIAEGKPKTRNAPTLEEGRRCTLIAPATTVKAAYKQWIGGSLATRGRLTIDKGCARALTRGKSLLAVGIIASEGDFGKGDPVEVFNEQGVEIARGLVRYDDNDVSKIMGVRSAGLKAALGYAGGPVVIHADDLALRESAAP